MLKKTSLRVRIYIILASLMFITSCIGIIAIWYSYKIEILFTDVVDSNVEAIHIAEDLESALVNQKGFVSYYFLDNNPDWLEQLGEYRQVFKERLKDAGQLDGNDQQRSVLDLIKKEYAQYIELKDRVINLYQNNQKEQGAEIHKPVREHFFQILQLCSEYKGLYRQQFYNLRKECLSQAVKLRIVSWATVCAAFTLSIILAYILIKQIFVPIAKLALETGREKDSFFSANEVKSLSQSVHGLILEVDNAQSQLDKSQESLLQAEKMAVIGKLAAGLAHSIRNPLTSVKMRLFSLNRTLNLTTQQEEDFNVISEEIGHIVTIVQNFLEFSRPPRLKMQIISPSEVVDNVLQLLHYKLESYGVTVKLYRDTPLPKILLDPDQLKEVLVNLIVNGCEAMNNGGTIEVFETEDFTKPIGSVAVIKIVDNGPGVTESIKAKIFQPFFTTKEEGTGLGLSIAQRIILEHGGRLELFSKEGMGAAFYISLPLKDEKIG